MHTFNMPNKIIRLASSEATKFTWVLSDPRVNYAFVSTQGITLVKRSFTLIAFIRSFSCMFVHVVFQLHLIPKSLLTEVALISIFISMTPFVFLHRKLVMKFSPTLIANKRFFFVFPFPMIPHSSLCFEDL